MVLKLQRILAVWVLAWYSAACTKNPPAPRPADAVIRVASGRPHFDPAVYGQTDAPWGSRLIFESLYVPNPADPTGPPLPHLASSLPEVLDGGRVYIIRLRRKVIFHDSPVFEAANGRGREMTASDLITAFFRIADPNVNSPLWKELQGKIEGLDRWRKSWSTVARDSLLPVLMALPDLKIVDRFTLRIELTQADPNFVKVLTRPELSIVPWEHLGRADRKPGMSAVGTGPYSLESNEDFRRVTLKRNPKYWGTEVLTPEQQSILTTPPPGFSFSSSLPERVILSLEK